MYRTPPITGRIHVACDLHLREPDPQRGNCRRASSSIACSRADLLALIPESIRAYVPAHYVTLGTDGFGRSDTRANLRDFFEVDAKWIAFTALRELPAGKDPAQLARFAEVLGVDLSKPLSTTV